MKASSERLGQDTGPSIDLFPDTGSPEVWRPVTTALDAIEVAWKQRRRHARTAGTCEMSVVQAGERSRRIIERLVLHVTMRCEPTGRSYRRVVARCTLPDGRSLSCAAITSGAAVRWDRYWLRYRMGDCR